MTSNRRLIADALKQGPKTFKEIASLDPVKVRALRVEIGRMFNAGEVIHAERMVTYGRSRAVYEITDFGRRKYQ
jgi:predicted transcriptional regulator